MSIYWHYITFELKALVLYFKEHEFSAVCKNLKQITYHLIIVRFRKSIGFSHTHTDLFISYIKYTQQIYVQCKNLKIEKRTRQIWDCPDKRLSLILHLITSKFTGCQDRRGGLSLERIDYTIAVITVVLSQNMYGINCHH